MTFRNRRIHLVPVFKSGPLLVNHSPNRPNLSLLWLFPNSFFSLPVLPALFFTMLSCPVLCRVGIVSTSLQGRLLELYHIRMQQVSGNPLCTLYYAVACGADALLCGVPPDHGVQDAFHVPLSLPHHQSGLYVLLYTHVILP
jgi:hypothetical protein